MIIVNKPFRKDDLVEINGILGKVTEIKMMTTELVTTDNRKIVMPNNLVSTSSIINISTYDRRRLDITVGVDYSTDLQKAKKVLLDLVAKEDRILVDPEPVVFISEKGASSIDFIVRFWVKAEDYWGVMWDYNEAVVERFRQEDISIPFNQLDVNLKMPTEWNNPEFNIMEKKFNSKFEKRLEKGAKKEQKYHDKIKEKNDTKDGKQ